MDEKTVFVVRFSNYEPAEVDSIWSTRERAERHIRKSNFGPDWNVEEWVVRDE